MTDATLTAPAPRSAHAPLSRLTFGGILRSEWIKLRSLRSTFWCYALILVLNVLLAWGISNLDLTGGGNAGGGPGGGPGAAATGETGGPLVMTVITAGLTLTALISAVLGSLVISGEYGTGMIKSTFTADPRRFGALFGKALVFSVVTFVIGFISMILSALIAMPGLSNANNVSLDWSDGKIWLGMVGGAGYLALVGLIAYGLGAIVRASAGAIAAAIGLVFVVPILFSVIGGLTNAKWITNIAAFLPSNVGATIYGYQTSGKTVADGVVNLDPTQSLLVLIGWVVVLVGLAAVLVKRRDA